MANDTSKVKVERRTGLRPAFNAKGGQEDGGRAEG